MIKFFRRIRQRLLTENKFSKYLLYAIGEIILVVIGILIALSINNWNEDRKESLIEKNYLRRLLADLENDYKSLFQRTFPGIESIRSIYYMMLSKTHHSQMKIQPLLLKVLKK